MQTFNAKEVCHMQERSGVAFGDRHVTSVAMIYDGGKGVLMTFEASKIQVLRGG